MTAVKKPRQKKTPQQRAEEALAVAERKVQRHTAERDKHRTHLKDAEAQLEAATRRRDYLRQDPDLPRVLEPASDDAG